MSKAIVFLLAISVVLLVSCMTTRNMATVRFSSEAETKFFNREFASKYNYFYCGPDHRPIAFLALDKSYSLNSEFWHRKELNDTTLQQWNEFLKKSTFTYGSVFQGREIIAPTAETVGFVLSRHYWVTAWFEDEDPKLVTIPQPDLTPMQPDRDRESRND